MTDDEILRAVREYPAGTARDVCTTLGYSVTRTTQAVVRKRLEALEETGKVRRSKDSSTSGWRWTATQGEDHEGSEGPGHEAR